MTRVLLGAAALVSVVAVSGCDDATSAADAPSAAPSAAPSVSVTAAPPSVKPSPAALTRAQAARRYLAIIRPYNVALERLEKGVNTGRPVPTLHQLAKHLVAANTAQVRALRGTPWPTAVRPAMRRLIAESAAAQRYWRGAMRAPTRAAMIRYILAAAKHDGAEPAAKIRRLLRLPGYDESRYS
jgi:hypothetical protein